MSSPAVLATGAPAAIEPATALARAREAARIVSFGPRDDVDAAPAAKSLAGSKGKSLPALDLTAKSYASTFNTSGPGSLLSMKHEMRVMSPQSGDGIVNIFPTTSGQDIGDPSLDLARKSSVAGLTKAVTIEVTPSRANVSALAPAP
jgi:NAD(P)-dependent dehydrogenase (short-subunit alcohol dehydrogenase family)